MADTNAIRAKVEKLLAMAADREGTPEGDTFRDKALELMAQYGVEASQTNTAGRTSAIRVDIEFSGRYTDMQFRLLNTLAHALHCHVVMFQVPRSSRVVRGVVFGREHHVERVTLLHSLLNPAMIAGATTMTQLHPDPFVSVTTQKRSWMAGFTAELGERLAAIEADHIAGYATVDSTGANTSGAVVVRGDAEAAEDLARQHFPTLKTSKASRRTVDWDAYARGRDEGTRMDLGQTRVGGQRLALPS